MRKLIHLAFAYAIAAMVGGVFFREFTKFNNYLDVTTLGKVHVHLFMLGTVVFLLLTLFVQTLPIKEQKTYKLFMVLYNSGLILTTIMFLVRGITQVLAVELSGGASASISGVAGIGHMLLGAGIVLLFITLKAAAKTDKAYHI